MNPPLVSLKLAVRKCQSYDLAKTRVIPLVKLEHQSYPIRRDDEMAKRIVKSWETLRSSWDPKLAAARYSGCCQVQAKPGTGD